MQLTTTKKNKNKRVAANYNNRLLPNHQPCFIYICGRYVWTFVQQNCLEKESEREKIYISMGRGR
jgi:hypothetical protein